MDDLRKRKIFREIVAFMLVIEYQKRGLPYAHMLVILETAIETVEKEDRIVTAELPDPVRDPELWETITTTMVDGPCGAEYPNAPCMQDGRGINTTCSKHFPKDLSLTTIIERSGYPKYQRHEPELGGYAFTKRIKQPNGTYSDFQYSNTWIVPYNPYLSQRFNCHINTEVCSSIQAVKYIYKYIYKGPDMGNIVVGEGQQQQINKVQNYLDARYISPPEACYRLLGLKMHDNSPAVYRLTIHLENKQLIYFDPKHQQPANALQNIGNRDTTLTAWFKANQIYPEGRNLIYANYLTK